MARSGPGCLFKAFAHRPSESKCPGVRWRHRTKRGGPSPPSHSPSTLIVGRQMAGQARQRPDPKPTKQITPSRVNKAPLLGGTEGVETLNPKRVVFWVVRGGRHETGRRLPPSPPGGGSRRGALGGPKFHPALPMCVPHPHSGDLRPMTPHSNIHVMPLKSVTS